MRFLTRGLVALFLLSLTAALLALAALTLWQSVADRRDAPLPGRGGQERVFAVPVVTVTSGSETPVLEAFGEIRALRMLELRVPQPGRVVELAPGFYSGATVDAGDLLLRIDPADATSARDLAAADLDRARGELRDAERALLLAAEDVAAAEDQAGLRARALDRARDLAGRGVGAAAAVEDAELALSGARQAVVSRRQALAQAEARRDQAETALARQRITLAEAERRLADTALHAAFAGRLADIDVVAGGLVAANERIGTLIDPAALEVRFRVSTAQHARLTDADGTLRPAPVTVALDVLGAEVIAEGRLQRAAAAVGEGQSGRELFARLDAPRGLLPGDFVAVRVTEPPLEGVARLPGRAVDADGQVLVVGADDRLAEAQVTVLRRQGDTVLVRATGLEGAEIVAARTPLLGAGIRVRPIRPDDAAADAAPDSGADSGTGPRMIALSDSRRAELIARVDANPRMPAEAKARLIDQLRAERVPEALVARLDARTDG